MQLNKAKAALLVQILALFGRTTEESGQRITEDGFFRVTEDYNG